MFLTKKETDCISNGLLLGKKIELVLIEFFRTFLEHLRYVQKVVVYDNNSVVSYILILRSCMYSEFYMRIITPWPNLQTMCLVLWT